ncbi:MAG: hypothetical protein ABSH09_23370 [Bryobacteraceae bacterium]|jgi:hypothetical protein
MRLIIFMLAASGALACQERANPPVPAAKREGKMPDKIDEAVAALQEFAKTRDAGALEKAVDSLEEFDIWSVKNDLRLETRYRLLLNWSRTLRAIDSIKQPGFDPEADPPLGHVAPAGGGQSSALSAQDARSRSQYEAAVKENEKKAAIHKTQLLVIELEERAVESAHRVVDRLYTSSAADRKEIDAAFQEAGLSEVRRKEVREGKE